MTRCVIVEAGDTDVDNQTIIDFAAEFDFVGGLILRADLDDPGLGHKLDAWQKLPKFRGMRMNFEAHPDPGIATKPAVIEGLRELARRGLIHDFLPLVRHLDGIATAIEQVPDLKCIIEHYGKPDFDGTLEPAWEQAMRRIARDTGAFCKLSLSPQVTRIQQYLDNPKQGWPIDAMAPVHRPLPGGAGTRPADLGQRLAGRAADHRLRGHARHPPRAARPPGPGGGGQAVPHQRGGVLRRNRVASAGGGTQDDSCCSCTCQRLRLREGGTSTLSKVIISSSAMSDVATAPWVRAIGTRFSARAASCRSAIP